MSHLRAIGSTLQNLRQDAAKGTSGFINSRMAEKSKEQNAVGSSLSASSIAGSGRPMKREYEAGKFMDAEKPVRRESAASKIIGAGRKIKRESDASYVSDPSPTKKKKTGSKAEFSCYVCNIECSSQTALNSHLVGKKHRKCLEELNEAIMSAASSTNDVIVADIQERFIELSSMEPLVGLEYVVEYQRLNSNHRYFCEMCDLRTNYESMLEHVISRQHRLRYMRTHRFEVYRKITGYPTFKNVMLPSEADKRLRQECEGLFHQVLKGKIRLCKVRQYKSEGDMKADLRNYQRPQRVHPSQHKDLLVVEKIMDEEEAIEKAKRTDVKLGINLRRLDRVESHGTLLDKPSNSSITTAAGASRSDNRDLIRDLLEVEQLENELLRSRLREKRLLDLDQQERRIVAAIRKLHQSINGAGMTREETIADDKLLMLLGSIRAEKRRLLLREVDTTGVGSKVESRGPGREIFSTRPSLLTAPSFAAETMKSSLLSSHRRTPLFSTQARTSLFPSRPKTPSLNMNRIGEMPTLFDVMRSRAKNNLPEPQRGVRKLLRETPYGPASQLRDTSANLSDVRKAVEPIIEETRQKVEEKIYEALSGGTLSSLIENFQSNPVLQASLKEWELQQSAKSGNVPSHSANSFAEGLQGTSALNTSHASTVKNQPYRSSVPYSSGAKRFDTIEEGTKHSSNQYQRGPGSSIPGGSSFGRSAKFDQELASMRIEDPNLSYSESSNSKHQFQNIQKESKASFGLLGSRPQFSGSSMKFHPGFY